MLKEQGIDVDEGGLQQVQGEDGDLLVVLVGAGEFAALSVEDNFICAVPGLDDLSALVYLPAECW